MSGSATALRLRPPGVERYAAIATRRRGHCHLYDMAVSPRGGVP